MHLSERKSDILWERERERERERAQDFLVGRDRVMEKMVYSVSHVRDQTK